MKNLILILVFFCGIPFLQSQPDDTWKTYKIDKGRKNFKPSESFFPFRATDKEVSLGLSFDSSAYFSPVTYYYDNNRLDRDYFDWHKGPGVTSFGIKPNNRNAFFLAWRPSPVKAFSWQVCVYVNDNDKGWTASPYVTVNVGEVVEANLMLGKTRIGFHIKDPDEIHIQQLAEWKRPFLQCYRHAGTWIGGANNSEGPFGDEAVQDMVIYTKTVIKR